MTARAARAYVVVALFLGTWGCGSPDRNVLVGSNPEGSDGGGGTNGGTSTGATTSGSSNGGTASSGGATDSNASSGSSTSASGSNSDTTSTSSGSTATNAGNSGGQSDANAGGATTSGDAMAGTTGPSTPDASADAARDAAADAKRDSGADAAVEASADARLDGVSEARPDAVADAKADAIDAGVDAGANGPDAAMDSGTCVNIAPFATASSSGGGATSSKIGPEALNDGVLVCGPLDTVGGWHWVFSKTVPSGDYIEYAWPSAQTVAMFHIDTVNNDTGCSYQGTQVVQVGRAFAGATVQYWNGAAWVTAGTISGKTDDFDYVLSAPVSTTQLRLYDVLSNSINTAAIIEWQVYGQTGCVSPLDP